MRCLKSIQFADEIIVVDAESTDRTVELARELGTTVVVSPWRGFAAQRNVCLEHCRGDWVFFIDADEEAEPELGGKLQGIAKGDPASHPNCYAVKRTEYFLGKRLDYGPGNPSFQWRFFKRQGTCFEGEVHEYPKFEGMVGEIRSTGIHHWPDLGIDRFLTKMNHYTTLEAFDRFAQGQRTSLWHAFGTFFSTLYKNGVRYQGFRNGREGLVLVLLESISRVVRHLKLWLIWKVHEGKVKVDLGRPLPEPGSVKPPTYDELEREVTGEPL